MIDNDEGHIMLGKVNYRELYVIGSGYSGEVKKVEDQYGSVYALKLSSDKAMKFYIVNKDVSNKPTILLPEAAEFERLRKLYRAGIPVPKPYAFQLYTNAAGIGNTALLMDLIKGKTLRDWLSDQPGGISDKSSGRSLHPLRSYRDAITRIEVTIAIIKSLLKLKNIAFFADLKPRNIMIKRHQSAQESYFSSYLVDIGGIVMYQDVSTSLYMGKNEGFSYDETTIHFHPLKDRYLVETTCSYLSPEMAFLVSEYDLWRGKLSSHYYNSIKENIITSEQLSEAEEVFIKDLNKWERLNAYKYELRLLYSYLSLRKIFSINNVLKKTEAIFDTAKEQTNNVGNEAISKINDTSNTNIRLMRPCPNDLIRISEKSTVFTIGLILCELFGGKRTGLTSLTRLKIINDMFLNASHNLEFRIALEWENSNEILEKFLHTANYIKCLQRTDRQSDYDESKYCISKINSVSTSAESNYYNKPYNEISLEMDSIDEDHSKHPKIRSDSFFNMYRMYCYPSEGLLKASFDTSNKSFTNKVQCEVTRILDSTLRMDPNLRPTLAQLMEMLQNFANILKPLD